MLKGRLNGTRKITSLPANSAIFLLMEWGINFLFMILQHRTNTARIYHFMNKTFTRYEVFLITILTCIQFTVTLDFTVLSPLGAILLPELDITTTQFGIVVSSYAWSAGASGFLAAGFADKYDRKKMLLFFYSGFIAGTLLCGVANDYLFLLSARIVTGIFGGVLSSISYAIVADLFSLQVRGRVMGFLQMALAGSTVIGLPVGLSLANLFNWHAPFLMIVGVCIIILLSAIVFMKSIDKHLLLKSTTNPFVHLKQTVLNSRYVKAFGCSVLIATGGFMLMPFGSAFAVNNNGILLTELPLLYLVTGIIAMIVAPMIGKFSDAVGKYRVFCFFSVLLMIAVLIHCNLGLIPFWLVVFFSTVMFVSYAGRIIASSALVTAVPEAADRGAFMSINSAVNMISGGIASLAAGVIVHQTPNGKIENYDVLGYVVSGAVVITIALMYVINKMVREKQTSGKLVHKSEVL
jgi:predicted MFS family arabinose efflux permease